jgi:hypothetical protein
MLNTLGENLAYLGAHEDADAVYERALALEPSNPTARLAKVGSLVQLHGGTDRARSLAAEMGFSAEDPFEGMMLATLALWDRDYERATALIDQLPSLPGRVDLLLRVTMRVAAGDSTGTAVADSLLAITPTDSDDGYAIGMRLNGLMGSGRTEELRREVGRLEPIVRRWDDAVLAPQGALALVTALGYLGDLDAGFPVLELLAERPGDGGSVTMLRLGPSYDPYRDDSRFEEIIRKREAFEAEGRRQAAAMRPFLP